MSQSWSLHLDDGVRRRLTMRFGDEIESWFDELPSLVHALAEQWDLELESTIPRGSVSVVIRCRRQATHLAVLKVSPDRTRLAREAAALDMWRTEHTPSVLSQNESVGALLIEAIEPGTPLVDSLEYPTMNSLAELLISLHTTGVPNSSFPPLAHRVTYLFDSGTKLYHHHPELMDLIPSEIYEQGRQFALQLAEMPSATALLHGDFTPSNILDGGERRGLVAIDPAPAPAHMTGNVFG